MIARRHSIPYYIFIVVYGWIKIFQTVMSGAKIAIRCSRHTLSRSVTQLFRSFQVTSKVVSGCYKIFCTVLGVQKVNIALPFSQADNEVFSFTRSAHFSIWVGCLLARYLRNKLRTIYVNKEKCPARKPSSRWQIVIDLLGLYALFPNRGPWKTWPFAFS